jgi:hypothetical protein
LFQVTLSSYSAVVMAPTDAQQPSSRASATASKLLLLLLLLLGEAPPTPRRFADAGVVCLKHYPLQNLSCVHCRTPCTQVSIIGEVVDVGACRSPLASGGVSGHVAVSTALTDIDLRHYPTLSGCVGTTSGLADPPIPPPPPAGSRCHEQRRCTSAAYMNATQASRNLALHAAVDTDSTSTNALSASSLTDGVIPEIDFATGDDVRRSGSYDRSAFWYMEPSRVDGGLPEPAWFVLELGAIQAVCSVSVHFPWTAQVTEWRLGLAEDGLGLSPHGAFVEAVAVSDRIWPTSLYTPARGQVVMPRGAAVPGAWTITTWEDNIWYQQDLDDSPISINERRFSCMHARRAKLTLINTNNIFAVREIQLFGHAVPSHGRDDCTTHETTPSYAAHVTVAECDDSGYEGAIMLSKPSAARRSQPLIITTWTKNLNVFIRSWVVDCATTVASMTAMLIALHESTAVR